MIKDLGDLIREIEEYKSFDYVPSQKLKHLGQLFLEMAGKKEIDESVRFLCKNLAEKITALDSDNPNQVRGFALHISNYRTNAFRYRQNARGRRVSNSNEQGLIRDQIKNEVYNYYGVLSAQQRSDLPIEKIMEDLPKVRKLVNNDPRILGAYLGIIGKKEDSRLGYERSTRTYTINPKIS